MRRIPKPLKLVPALAASALPQCRYDRMVLVLGHMRSGSTALSNVLCAHPDISGYGETHVTHGLVQSGGAIVINQWRRKAWRPTAKRLFDKVLHNQYDSIGEGPFFKSKAIFLARKPSSSLQSLRHMSETLNLGLWRTDEDAAQYYEERLLHLFDLWERFAPSHRLALTNVQLMSDPDDQLARMTSFLGLSQPLTNAYQSRKVSQSRGAGDPFVAGQQSQIVAKRAGAPVEKAEKASLQLPSSRLRALDVLYERFEDLCVPAPVGAS